MSFLKTHWLSKKAKDLPAPIRIGVLHSLSGTMAISETTLRDVMLMLVEE
ncbi:MAG: ABC transporter substrate-binding protein, partial [Candidatus Omnitrophica bacterium]|nr:ABC transporter substrate-binding protein [Candidatus Omnitrophota bacterium]